MLTLISMIAALSAQDALPELNAPRRPAVECAEHVRDDSARRSCLRGLLDDSEESLDEALREARNEAEEIDMDFPGFANARAGLDAAHTAWITYRDAECERRAALLLMGEDGDELALDCQIALTRARAAELREN